jgi:hypothetical protein
MTIAELEMAILEQLQEDITEYQIELFPDNVSEYDLIHPNGSILIVYAGTNYTNPKMIQQLAFVDYNLIVLSRNLRSHTGAYAIIDKARKSITSMNINNSSFFCKSEKFVSNENDIWIYELSFSLPALFYLGE